MKNSFFLIPIFVFTFLTSVFAGEPLQFAPENPTPGETLKITYHVEKTALKDLASFDAIAYLYQNNELFAFEIELMKKGAIYHGEVITTKETQAVFVLFENGDKEIIDNNDEKGYKVMMYMSDRETPVAGAQFAVGKAYYMDARSISVTRDMEKGMKYMKKEMAMYPESKMNVDYLGLYLSTAGRAKDKAALEDLRAIAETFSKEKKSEEKLGMAHSIYKSLEEEELAEKLELKIKKKYPKGQLVKSTMMNDFFAARRDPAKMNEAYAQLEKLLDLSKEDDKRMMENMAISLAMAASEKGDLEKLDKYLALSEEVSYYPYLLNSVAVKMAGGSLEEEATNLEAAEKYAKKALDFSGKKMKNPADYKPENMTEKQFARSEKGTFANVADTYALVCYKSGKTKEALKYQEKALKMAGEPAPEWYERYSVYYEKEKGGVATEALLAGFIQENKASEKMVNRYKALFLANNTMETAFEKNLAMLEKEGMKKFRKELKKKMIDQPAPDFDLVNLKGESVKLSDMKGKVVVLDFWATWCGPCKRSFPAMQSAQEKYGDDGKVVFLFVNSWERVKNIEETVSAFIQEHNYPFNVPLDKDNKVIGSYKVEGIPTKFVVGPNGNIRFKSVGFGGSDESLVKEMGMMIELAQGIGDTTASAN